MRARAYRMVRRAEHVDETRRQIIEATVRLHTTVGPAATSIAAIAEEAGVTRLTVYRHFPDIGPLFTACRAHWMDTHPGPDAARWSAVSDTRERALMALGELYAYYRANAADLTPIYRDVGATPASSLAEIAAGDDVLAEALAGPGWQSPAAHRLRAAARHLVRFTTWKSLAAEGGLGDVDAAELGAALIAFAAEGSATAR